jgi:hypothetical protein
MTISKTLAIFVAICFAFLVAGCGDPPPGIGNGAKTSDADVNLTPQEQANKFEKFYKGHPKKRSWHTYDIDTPPPLDDHIKLGEVIQLEKTGNKIKLKPKGKLGARWKQLYNIDEIELDEDEGEPGEPDLLCGEIYLNHGDPPVPQKHILSLQRKDDSVTGTEELTITYADENSGETCRSLGTHGGAAHLR